MEKNVMSLSIVVMLLASAACAAECGGASGMEVSFGASNEVLGVRVGAAEFAAGGGDLWTAEFASTADLTNRVKVLAGSAASFAKGKHGGVDALFWRDLPLGGERGVLDARVLMEKRPDGSQAWRLEFDNRSAKWALFSTDFPRLARVMRNGEGDAMLPAADYGARLLRKCVAAPRPVIARYLGYAPMVAAFFIGDDGLYIAAEDPDARIKNFAVEGEQNICFRTPVELGAEGPRYDVVLAPLKGDWWAAARRYRSFALGQKWAAKGPIKDIPGYPKRICEIPLWINIHGYPDMASNVLTRARTRFPAFPTGLHWHLWQHSGHDVNYPEYFPEKHGTKECLTYCRSIGQEPMPYTNGRLWTATTSGYLMAERYAVMNADGTRNVERYGNVVPPTAVMCPACPEWWRVVRSFTGRVLNDLGATSIFIDQIGAAPAKPCYDSSHSHPAGGGSWWRDGYAKMMEPIRREWNEKGAFVTTEGAGEAYMDLVDGYLQVTERRPDDVPFWSAVYSGYTTYFCSPGRLDDDLDSFRVQQTREMLWGHPLGWFSPNLLDKKDLCLVIEQLCGFRQTNLDALAYGNLLDELSISSQLESVSFAWGSHFNRKREKFTGAVPAVIGNWWRTADGKTVLLAANLTGRPQTATYAVFGANATAKLSLGPHELKRIELSHVATGE